MRPRIIISKVTNPKDVNTKVSESLNILSVTFDDDDFVAIKPNLCDYRPPEQGGTTDPKIVEAIITFIRKQSSCKIAIIESNHALATADEEFQRMNYRYLEDKFDKVSLINLSTDKQHQIEVEGYYFSELTVAETLLKMTKYINVAKLKTHTQTRITCILKNQFGLVSRRYKKRYHHSLSEVLLDLVELFPPDISVIDGLYAMEGAGPSDGDVKKTDILLFGDDPFATDVVAAKIMGIKPSSVPVLKLAKRKNISDLEYEVINDLPNFNFKQVPWYSFAVRRFGLKYQKQATKRYNKKKGRAKFLSDVAAGFIVIRQGKYSTLQSGLIDRRIFWRVVMSIIRRPSVLINHKLKGI
ncbi:MAG: DUF362 domain-containing protein [Candidatus Heimdallarchaeota archaeon]|nr:DUF362 domain-containing protein [Candidatus Heimdallarchaeota archaeon]